MGHAPGSNCPCGSVAKNPDQPNQAIIISQAEAAPVSALAKALPDGLSPEEIAAFLIGKIASKDLKNFTGKNKAFQPFQIYQLNSFCAHPADYHYEPGENATFINDAIDRKWQENCKCKHPCPGVGFCPVPYEINTSTPCNPAGGSVFVTGPLGNISASFDGYFSGAYQSYHVRIIAGAGESASAVSLAACSLPPPYTQESLDSSYQINFIRRADRQPDECPDPSPPAPEPPLPINPPIGLYGSDPPLPPPPPNPDPPIIIVLPPPGEIYIPRRPDLPCPPCSCDCPPPPPPQILEVPVEMPGIPGAPGAPGSPGAPGAPGIPGLPGLMGLAGRDGRDGNKGDKGDQGEKGDKGDQGDQGEKGDKGDQGDKAKVDFVNVTVQAFDKCNPDTHEPIFKDLIVPAIKGTEGQIIAEFARMAAIEGQQCKPIDCTAAVPEWWQVRIEAHRPQLVILLGEKQSDGKIGPGHYALTIPHYVGGQTSKPPIGNYQKGQIEGILTLNDNSKVMVNAISEAEANRVLLLAKQVINPDLLEGSFIKTGTRRGQILKVMTLIPRYGKFFSAGLQNTKPDWTIYYG